MSDIVLQSIMNWIKSAQTDGRSVQVSPETSVAENQLLDSLQIMDLVTHLETTHEINVPLDALTETNFSTPKTIAQMVQNIKTS